MVSPFATVRLALALLLGAAPLAAQRAPGKGAPAAPVIREVLLAAYARAPYAAFFRAPGFTFLNGDLVMVRGSNFGAQGTRSLQLRANGRVAAMTVSVWTDTLIRGHVPGGRAVGIELAGPQPLRRDLTGVIAVAAKTDRTWGAGVPIKVAFLWNWQRGGDRDGDGVKDSAAGGDDCDDRDPRRYPGNAEIADDEGVDEDCDPSTIGNRDADGDGYVDQRVFNWVNGRVTMRGRDCDDLRTNVNPRSVEACNNRDDNCDGWIDEELLNCPTANRRVGPPNP